MPESNPIYHVRFITKSLLASLSVIECLIIHLVKLKTEVFKVNATVGKVSLRLSQVAH